MENSGTVRLMKSGNLAVGSDNISEIIEFINKNKIQQIEIADWHIRTKYTVDNVDFLKECPSITHLSIHAEAIKDFSAITALPNLKDLHITLSKKSAGKVSVNGLKNLTDLGLENAVEIIGLEDCVNLKTLFLYGYKPKSKDFAALKVLKNLKSFTNRFGNMTSLEGIGGLGVKEAEFSYMRNLEDISDIAWLADNLTDLDFTSCRKIQSYDILVKLKKLEKLKLNSCSDIPSLGFISQMEALKEIMFCETTVTDMDISPCIGLDYIGFTNKRGYSHTFEELNPEFAAKLGMQDEEDYGEYTLPDNLEDMRHKNPTVRWRASMEEGDEMFCDDGIRDADAVLKRYIDKLIRTNETNNAQDIEEYIKTAVLELNKINREYEFIETYEREELCDFILEAAKLNGFKEDNDITEQWREW